MHQGQRKQPPLSGAGSVVHVLPSWGTYAPFTFRSCWLEFCSKSSEGHNNPSASLIQCYHHIADRILNYTRHFKLHNKGNRTQALQLAFVITCFLLNRQSPINRLWTGPLKGGRGCARTRRNLPPYVPGIANLTLKR